MNHDFGFPSITPDFETHLSRMRTGWHWWGLWPRLIPESMRRSLRSGFRLSVQETWEVLDVFGCLSATYHQGMVQTTFIWEIISETAGFNILDVDDVSGTTWDVFFFFNGCKQLDHWNWRRWNIHPKRLNLVLAVWLRVSSCQNGTPRTVCTSISTSQNFKWLSQSLYCFKP